MSNYSKLGFAGFINSIGNSLYMPFLIIFLQQVAGGQLFNAAVLLAAYEAIRSVFTPLFGWISDKTGRRGWMILANFGGAYMTYRLALVLNLSQIYPIMVFAALFSAMGSTGGSMMQDLTEGEKQGSQINILGIIFSIGGAIGLALGGNLVELYGFQFLFILGAIITVISNLPLFFFKKGDGK